MQPLVCTLNLPAEEFVARRARIMDAVGSDGSALLQGAPMPRGYVRFRQTNDFYYCCGLETPQSYLLLDGARRRSALFLPWRGKAQLGEGAPPGAEDEDLVRRITGVEAVCPLGQLSAHLAGVRVIYTPHAPAEVRGANRPDLYMADKAISEDAWDGRPSREQSLIALLRTRLPGVTVRDLTPILDELRSIKSVRELNCLRRSGRLCALAVREAMRATSSGVREYQLGALANYIYLLHGARGEGYRPIIAAGDNIWHVHYFRCDAPLEEGQLVLMDMAPECDYYTSDIGRMWPVGGTYSTWQRELYGFVVEYHKVLLAHIRPGVTPDQVMDEAATEMARVWEGWPFGKEVRREGARRTLEFRGHLSHPVGMAVHDDGDYHQRPLLPGTVFAVDPQMWIPEERLYIRVEDTVAVRTDGIENLTRAAPLDLDDVETLMRDGATELPYLSLL